MWSSFSRVLPALALLLTAPAGVRADAVDDLLRTQMQRNHIPGAAVAIIRAGAIEKIQGYGVANLEHNAPVTTSSAFQVASTTKIFTGILLAHLVDQGRLSLDDPVQRYLPQAPAGWAGMTIRQLGNHTAGFAMSEPGPTSDTMAQAIAAIMNRPLEKPPGEREQYALDDFILLAHIMETASGRTYQQLLDEVIVKPLGLKNTRFENGVDRGSVNRADVIPGRVTIYSHENGMQRMFWFLYPPASYAAGGLYTSIEDMARVMLAIDKGALLSASGRNAVWTPARLNNGKGGTFGIGWIAGTVRGKPSVGHSGGPALGDLLYVPGERLAVVVLTNQRSMSPTLAQAVAARLLPAPGFIHDAGMKDVNVKLSQRLFDLVRALARGDARGDQVSGGLRDDLVEYNEWTARQLSVLPPPTRMILLADEHTGAKHRRTYRVVYGTDASQRWRFDLDGAGLVERFDISEE